MFVISYLCVVWLCDIIFRTRVRNCVRVFSRRFSNCSARQFLAPCGWSAGLIGDPSLGQAAQRVRVFRNGGQPNDFVARLGGRSAIAAHVFVSNQRNNLARTNHRQNSAWGLTKDVIFMLPYLSVFDFRRLILQRVVCKFENLKFQIIFVFF